MTEKYAIIRFTGVSGHHPAPSYIERIELPSDQFRVRRVGIYEEKFMTEQKHELTTESVSRQQLIRSVAYDKWQVQFPVNEFQNVELLGIARNVTITLDDGTIHNAVILEMAKENTSGTDYSIVTITYFDRNTDNYIGSCVNDYLTSSAVVETFEPGELHKLYIKTGFSQTIYTAIEIEKFIADIQETGETVNGLHRNSRVIVQTGYKLQFYLNEAETVQLQERLAKFTPGTGDVIRLTISGSGQQLTAVERITPEIEKIDTDLYRVNLALKYESETFNNYN